jgi:hypothetical protein
VDDAQPRPQCFETGNRIPIDGDGIGHVVNHRKRIVAEVTYFVALPVIAADDGVAAGEPTESFNPTAVVMRAEALSRKPGLMTNCTATRTSRGQTGRGRLRP